MWLWRLWWCVVVVASGGDGVCHRWETGSPTPGGKRVCTPPAIATHQLTSMPKTLRRQGQAVQAPLDGHIIAAVTPQSCQDQGQ